MNPLYFPLTRMNHKGFQKLIDILYRPRNCTERPRPMPIIILIPTIVCIWALFRDSTQKAFLNVFLPIFMLFPVYYFWKVSSLPPIDLSEATLIPLGVAMLIKDMPRWKISTMDVSIAVFVFTSYYADSIAGRGVASIFNLFSSLCLVVVPYMAGKVLIEQTGSRVATVKRIVILLFVASLIAAYEYRMGQNPFTLVWARFFPGESFAWKTQIRWGFGRVSGPYGQSELAGMMLFFGLVLALWLGFNKYWEAKFSRARWLPFSKGTVIAWTIGITLLMTQARGPWLGSLVAVPIAMIGRSKNVLRSAILTTLLIVVAGGASYVGLKKYADAPATSAEQETASYRSQLVTNYMPVAVAGGPWGWGTNFPHVGGQGSIDNEYLFVALVQGWVGLAAFCLVAFETTARLIAAAVLNRTRRDRYFAYSLLGSFLGILLTICTVYLGNQPFELFFMIAGWSQAVMHRESSQPQVSFEHVYT